MSDYLSSDWPSAPPMSSLIDRIHCADIFDLCAALPRQSVDMILADLPYGTTACTWDMVIPFEPMWAAFKRVIKPRGAIVLTASQPFTSALVMSNVGMFKYSWVWDKVSTGDVMNAKNKPLKQHEDVCVFSLGTTANTSPNLMSYYPQGVVTNTRRGGKNHTKLKTAFRGVRPSHAEFYQARGTNYPSSIITFSNADHTEAHHPTQKPVALFRYLIRTYTLPGELVFDPTCGSGTTAMAAREEGRHFICGDSSAEYVAIARKRLAQPYTPSFMLQLEVTA